MVNAPRSQTHLGNFKAAAFAQQHVFLRYAHVVEFQVHVAMGCIVMSEHMHRAKNFQALRIHRHQNLRLLAVTRRIRAGLDHADHDFATRVARAGDVVLLTIDHPLIADEFSAGADVLCIGRRQARLSHAEARADFAVQQRLQPALFLFRRADPLQHFHVAGVRCAAVQTLGSQRLLAELGGNVGVIQVG